MSARARSRTVARWPAADVLAGLLEAAPDAIIAVDERGRMVIANSQAERLFGYSRAELVGAPIDMLVPERMRGIHPVHRVDYYKDPRPRPMGVGRQLAARRKDGTEFPAEISLGPVETDEGLLVAAAIRDVTARLEIEAERERLRADAERERFASRLEQSQRLESLGQLAGGVAHDFNNLLAVIRNYAAFVGEEVAAAVEQGGGERWQVARDDVAQIERAAERATQLIHQLLAFARREVVRPQVVDLNAIIVEVRELLHRSLGEHVELVTSLDPEPWHVLADPGQVEQVLVNLCVNARDAMPDGGRLTIDTENITVDAGYAAARPDAAPGPHVKLTVSDTGAGMPAEVRERAFEPFFTTKPKGEGSGLGLATVYGIIRQAGGHAHIYSEPGLGTTFTAMLPATDEVPEMSPQSAETRAAGGETVLVVEDEDAMREVTRRILDRNGYTVLTAPGGAAALELAAGYADRIDLLLTDVVMPRMLGKELADRICAVRRDIRVLFMSGYAQPVLGSKGTLDPGVILVQKPFSEHQLLAKVREVLDRAV